MKSIVVFVMTLLMTTGIYGQQPQTPELKGGSVVVVNEFGGIELEGCPCDGFSTENQLLVLDEFGNLINTRSFKGDIVEFKTSEFNTGKLTLVLMSGDCSITKEITVQ